MADTTARHGLSYLYTVEVRAAGQERISSQEVGQLLLPPVQMVRADLDSRTATASLQWERYQGPRFAAYRIWRHTGDERADGLAQTSSLLLETTDPTATAHVDSHLVGTTEYKYEVQVLTERGEVVPGNRLGGVFHRLVGEWSLETPPLEPGTINVRLYTGPGEGISALVATPTLCNRRTWDRDGQPLAEQNLFAMDVNSTLVSLGQSWAMAADLTGRMLVSVPFREDKCLLVLRFGPNGMAELHEREYAIPPLPAETSPEEGAMLPEIAMRNLSTPGNWVTFDNLSLSSAGRPVLSDDFAAVPNAALAGEWQGWRLSGNISGPGSLRLAPGAGARHLLETTTTWTSELTASRQICSPSIAPGRWRG